MKKLKLILTAFALLLGWSNAWADEVIDITSKRLTNANLSSLTGWTFDDSFSAEGNDYTDYKTDGDVNVVEFYSEWAGTPGAMASSKNFKMTQTVTLSAGTYRLSAYGFYREKNGDGTNIKAYLKAGTNQSYINGLSSDGLSGYTGSNDLYKAANAFSRGDFNNTLEFTLDSKQNIEVGIVGTFNTQCSWCIVGPMSLVKVLEGGIELTEVIINPSFETGDMTGWSALREGVVVDPTSLSDCKVHTIESHPLTNADGEYLMNYYGWSWSWNANANGIEQTIPNMPAGNYRITAVLGGWAPTTAEGFSEPAPWEMTLKVNDVEQNKEMVTDDAGVSFSVDITLASATDLTITATTIHKGQNKWEACFMKADNFRIFNLDNYYDALNEAIAYAEDNYPLGFDNGEYAPYNNVDAIGYLKAAKDVNQGGYIDWDELQTIVSNLKSATWTANVGEVNAFAYGDFSTYQTISGKDYPYGWQLNNGTDGNNSRIMGGTEGSGNAGLAASSTGKALLLKWNASYGETQGYTMPLNASTLYKITFTYCGWGGNSPHTNIVMTDPNSNNITLNPAFEPIGSHGESYTSDWTIFTGYFVSTTAGNYTFNLNKQEGGQQQIAIADIELKSSNDALDFADGSVRPTYAPGTYPSVKVTRSLAKDRWATAIYPFAVTACRSCYSRKLYRWCTRILYI